MLLMVTNRKFSGGNYGDEEMPDFQFEYQHGYNNAARGEDAFLDKSKDITGFRQVLLSELDRLKKGGVSNPKVGLYVHGYNNNYQDSIDEIYDLEKNLTHVLGYAPVVVGFSWPSAGKTIEYLSDREEVRDSVGAFTRFLVEVNKYIDAHQRICFSDTFCVAHSMGNYLLRKGMYLYDHCGAPRGRMLFNEMLMLAPDLSAKDMGRDGKGVYVANFSRRVHIYYSQHDGVISVSSIKRFGSRRLGRHGPDNYENLPANVVAIDAKQYANDKSIAGVTDREGKQVSVHSSHRYHPRILQDVSQVISGVDRDCIAGRQVVSSEGVSINNHYKLVELPDD